MLTRNLYGCFVLLLLFAPGQSMFRNYGNTSNILSFVNNGNGSNASSTCSIHSPMHCADGVGCIHRVGVHEFCDGVEHCSDGSDELTYNPDIHDKLGGVNCFVLNSLVIRNCYLPKEYICDQESDCTLGTDECYCDHTFICDTSPAPEVDQQCVSRGDFCDNILDCLDASDEKKFSPGVPGYQCAVSKTRETSLCMLPTQYTCDGVQECDFGTDECFCNGSNLITDSYSNGDCFRCLDETLVIPQRQLCDGKFQCKDLSDECLCSNKPDICHQICKVNQNCDTCEVGQFLCKKQNESAPIECLDKSAVCDGSYDCPLEDDELSCNMDFSELFNCSDGSMYIPKRQLCDKKIDCHDGSDEKNCSELFFECYPESVYDHPVRKGAYSHARPRYTVKCDRIPDCEDLEDECNVTLCGDSLPKYCDLVKGTTGFICPGSLSALIGSQICDGFPSCDENSPETSADEFYCEHRLYCKDRGAFRLPIHIDKSSECDAISDCYDESDELHCSLSTHFYCNNGVPRYVPRSKVCNGVQDCTGGEDECQDCSDSPFSSDSFLINSYVLQVFIWIIGLFAVVGNIGVISHNSWQIWMKGDMMSKVAFNHRILVISLGLADLLLGLYLISLGITNSIYSGTYCTNDSQWRSSYSCGAMGIMVVISTECSIFLLVTMATMRFCLVTWPFNTFLKSRYIVAAILLCWVMAITLATIPISENLMDYFLSEVWYQNNPFLTFATRQKVQELATSLWSLQNNSVNVFSNNTDGSLSWKSMIEAISRLNGTYVPNLYFGYYSAHGVCLPRIFPDSTRDLSWGFSFFIVTVNFTAFIYMLGIYIAIYKITTARSRNAGRTNSDAASLLLQRKISRIIFTNFCCWIPICLMAFISSAGGYISKEVYAVSAIILLPINCAFNPLLYSDLPEVIGTTILTKTRWGKWLKAKRLFRTGVERDQQGPTSTYSTGKETRCTKLGTCLSAAPKSPSLVMETRT